MIEGSKKRDQLAINTKISNSLKGRVPANCFKQGYDRRRKDWKKERELLVTIGDWNDLSLRNKKERILREQNRRCVCGIYEWNNQLLTLELDHINGDNKDNRRENLRILCPNCHSLTPTFRSKNIKFHPLWKNKL